MRKPIRLARTAMLFAENGFLLAVAPQIAVPQSGIGPMMLQRWHGEGFLCTASGWTGDRAGTEQGTWDASRDQRQAGCHPGEWQVFQPPRSCGASRALGCHLLRG
jgi:hypothetical protein